MSALLGNVAALSACLLLLLCCCSAVDEAQLARQLSASETRLDAALSTHTITVRDRLDRLSTFMTSTKAELTNVRGELLRLGNRLDGLPATPRDCSDLPVGSPGGVHLISPGLDRPVPALCEQATDFGGAWTVIQRRGIFEVRQDFFLGWLDYKWGFGQLDGEFWWGLENIWLTTSMIDRQYELRIDMEDFTGEKRFATYGGFRITSELDGYRLDFATFEGGDAGDSLSGHHGQAFTTRDKDNNPDSPVNCANTSKGAWWYKNCHDSNLNGEALEGPIQVPSSGIQWSSWKGSFYSLKAVTMKIRPTKKL